MDASCFCGSTLTDVLCNWLWDMLWPLPDSFLPLNTQAWESKVSNGTTITFLCVPQKPAYVMFRALSVLIYKWPPLTWWCHTESISNTVLLYSASVVLRPCSLIRLLVLWLLLVNLDNCVTCFLFFCPQCFSPQSPHVPWDCIMKALYLFLLVYLLGSFFGKSTFYVLNLQNPFVWCSYFCYIASWAWWRQCKVIANTLFYKARSLSLKWIINSIIFILVNVEVQQFQTSPRDLRKTFVIPLLKLIPPSSDLYLLPRTPFIQTLSVIFLYSWRRAQPEQLRPIKEAWFDQVWLMLAKNYHVRPWEGIIQRKIKGHFASDGAGKSESVEKHSNRPD